MKRKKRFVPILTFLLIAAAIFFIYTHYTDYNTTDIYPVFSENTIAFSKDEDLHFFSEGWIVCGKPSRFYYWDQSEMLPPFSQNDLSAENGSINIIAQSNNYIVTENNRIYSTDTVPFKLVYENHDARLWDIKEYSDYLMLMIREENDVVKPYVLVNGSNFLINMDGTGESKYISVDSYDKNVSLLTLSLNSPFPVTRVFHYINRNELYGVLTLENQFIYDILRLKNSIILIGINDILCYNIEGELQWSIKHETNGNFEVIPLSEEFLVYFPEKAKLDDKKGNALFIDSKGYTIEMLPKYLTSIKALKNGFAALEYGNTLVFMNKSGKAVNRQKLQEPAAELYTCSFRPDNIYVRTRSNTLQLYTTHKQEEENQ